MPPIRALEKKRALIIVSAKEGSRKDAKTAKGGFVSLQENWPKPRSRPRNAMPSSLDTRTFCLAQDTTGLTAWQVFRFALVERDWRGYFEICENAKAETQRRKRQTAWHPAGASDEEASCF